MCAALHRSGHPSRRRPGAVLIPVSLGLQVLKSGDAVVAAARRPEKSQGLTKLKEQHGKALQLVRMDVDDHASIKVQEQPRAGVLHGSRMC